MLLADETFAPLPPVLVLVGGPEGEESTVVNGKGRMPAQTSLKDQDIADAFAYLKATF